MAIQLEGIDQWREYFKTAKADSDIFEIIEKGILVAASDCPKEFKLRRDRIAELLFSTRLTRCTQCDLVGLSVPELGEGGGGAARVDFVAPGASKESKAQSGGDDHTNPITSNFSYGVAEALTAEIEEEELVLEDVMRIKDVLCNFEEESDSVLFESLRRLQLMRLTVSILKATEIGKAVNGLRKHDAKEIRHLTRELIGEWKATVDEYMESAPECKEPTGTEETTTTPDSINPSVVEDEEGLPSPPLDDCAFFTTQCMDFDQFFDGMDDDGNPQTSEELTKNRESERRPPVVKPVVPLWKEQPPKEKAVLPKEDKFQPPRKQEPITKPSNKPLNPASGPGRPVKPSGEQRINPAQNLQKKSEKPIIQRRPAIQPEKLRSLDEDLVQEKIEATKRRLQESYQEAKDAKKQRKIQVMELHDLPKQGGQRNAHNKFGNPNRKWGNARR